MRRLSYEGPDSELPLWLKCCYLVRSNGYGVYPPSYRTSVRKRGDNFYFNINDLRGQRDILSPIGAE